MGLLSTEESRSRHHGSPFKGGGVIEDTKGLHLGKRGHCYERGGEAMEVAMGVWIRGGGYRERQ